MQRRSIDGQRRSRPSLRAGAALALFLALGAAPGLAIAQEIALPADLAGDGQMLLEADTLIYDNDNQTVTAVGDVRVDYNGYKLVAQRLTYDQRSGRLMASGGVEMVDPKGTKYSSSELDITDDFRDGFVNALRVETADKIYFGAERAERADGTVTTFMNGVYTACEPCEEQPDKAPIWRVKARKIIWDGKAKTIRFEAPSFEFFGMPIARLPYFEVADPTVKRKSGFLLPSIGYSSQLGASLRVPYYLALGPTYDATLYGSAYTNQGFLGDVEWRQRFDSGAYSLRAAGIHQTDPGAFAAGTVDAGVTNRGMIGSSGRFTPNSRWVFGWDALLQSDKNFAYRYKIDGYSALVHTSQLFLTGLNDRNSFDLRAMKFTVQEAVPDADPASRNPRQPWVLPSFDYHWTPDQPIAGGELDITVNGRALRRTTADQTATALPGAEGVNARLTTEAEWKRTFVAPGGLAVTPILAVRGDAHYLDNTAIASITGFNAAADARAALYRSMATAGLELRWPVLFSTTSASHILEPIAQIFVRPNETHADALSITNEDAQSLVFDAASLFDRDKFSGFDRIEGGTRVNLGLRYSGSFANGWSANAVFGQSFHVAGANPFASADLVNVGAFSGLETARSDYVGMVGLGNGAGMSASLGGRFDETTFAVRRAEAAMSLTGGRTTLSGRYAFIGAQPLYGYAVDRHEVTLAASTRLAEDWRVYGSGTYDLQSQVLTAGSLGLGYADECFAYSLTYTETRSVLAPADVRRNIGFSVSLRTIGDFGTANATSFD